MKPLGELAAVLPVARLIGAADTPVPRFEFHIDDVRPGDMFVAIKGHMIDGHDNIARAIAAGARTIACTWMTDAPEPGIGYVVVPDTIRAMGPMAHAFHGFPSRRMRVVGVTGTNGKTTVATLLHRGFRAIGRRAGLLSTVRNCADAKELEWTNTIGHALQIAAHMARMVEAGCSHCFLEATSQGIHQDRLAGIEFDGGIFTNLSHDHLNYHGTMADYARAKKAFFDALPAGAFALANADDPRGAWMLAETAATRWLYGTAQTCDFRLELLEEGIAGLRLRVNGRTMRSRLIGAFNAHNLAACLGAASLLGEEEAAFAEALAALPAVDGRMQRFTAADGRTVVVDYAHSPDAVDKALRSLAAALAPGGRLITVIGCGGDCDQEKRPIMGRAAARASDQVFLTSDNPRSEDPAEIAAQMASGVSAEDRWKIAIRIDRGDAIRAACALAGPDDLVLIAGKGHERTQQTAGAIHPFDDSAVACKALRIDTGSA